MNSWASRRKFYISLVVTFFLTAFLGFPVYFFLHRTPTCLDNKQNGLETGIDCGGSCQKVCKSEALPILMKGDPRVFKLSNTTYAVALEVENPNTNSEIFRAGYTLRIYEKDNPTPLKIIEDSTFVPANSQFAIYFGPLSFSSSTPSRATFEWMENEFNWQKTDNTQMPLTVQDKNLNASSTTKLSASLYNPSSKTFSNIELVALISDTDGNISTASKTFVDSISPNSEVPVVFTWPSELGSTTQVEILPRVLPDISFIK
ncbi:hypothetical protein KW790_03470 [Candidatus Parcubacteria bacterium]|nr:hypothetical protein [Candidatus Parcubacteria bacterium]